MFEHIKIARIKTALPNGTVRTFLTALTSKLTVYDQRMEKKEPNPYRLSHWFGAVEKVEQDVKSYLNRADAEAMGVLKRSLGRRFNLGWMPPVRRLIKEIDGWLQNETPPKLR